MWRKYIQPPWRNVQWWTRGLTDNGLDPYVPQFRLGGTGNSSSILVRLLMALQSLIEEGSNQIRKIKPNLSLRCTTYGGQRIFFIEGKKPGWLMAIQCWVIFFWFDHSLHLQGPKGIRPSINALIIHHWSTAGNQVVGLVCPSVCAAIQTHPDYPE